MVPKLLILANNPPALVSVGGLLYATLCRLYPRDRVCYFHLAGLSESEKCPDLDWLPREHVPGPRKGETGTLPALASQVAEFGKTHKVELIWVQISTPTMVRLAGLVADLLAVPLILSVLDPPTYKMRLFNLDDSALEEVLATFAGTVRRSARCAVASPAMKQRYEQDFGTECVPVAFSAVDRPGSVLGDDRAIDDRFIIGITGSIYAKAEWQAFLQALCIRNWRVSGRDVVIKVIGRYSGKSTTSPSNVEFLGWRDPKETVKMLSRMDLAYVPYWFADEYSDAVQYSFPSKLSTAVVARTPVFFHGPRTSSVSTFMERYPVGIGCHSLAQQDIIVTLEQIIMDRQWSDRARQACDAAYRVEIGATKFREGVAKVLGIREDELRSIENIDAPVLN